MRIGNYWYVYLCEQRSVDPVETFRRLVREHGAPRLRPPFHTQARKQAGFNERELALLEELAVWR